MPTILPRRKTKKVRRFKRDLGGWEDREDFVEVRACARPRAHTRESSLPKSSLTSHKLPSPLPSKG